MKLVHKLAVATLTLSNVVPVQAFALDNFDSPAVKHENKAATTSKGNVGKPPVESTTRLQSHDRQLRSKEGLKVEPPVGPAGGQQRLKQLDGRTQ